MDLAITLVDGRVETVSVVPRDLVAFERHYHCSFIKISDSMTFEQTMFLAHQAMRRTQKFEGDFESFIDAVQDFGQDEEEADPQTPPG